MYSSDPYKRPSLTRGFIPSFQQERMARSLGRRNDVSASVHHGQTDRDVSRIEIPAELAYVYSKLDGK